MRAKCDGPSGLPGKKCGKPVVGHGLCAAHYRQKQRHPNENLQPLGTHKIGDSKQVTFLIEAADAETIIAEAKDRRESDATVYREAVHAHAVAIRKRGAK
jgi:hypothetical protein